MTTIYRTTAFLPLSSSGLWTDDGYVLLRILVYVVALSLFVLLGWLADQLLRSERSAAHRYRRRPMRHVAALRDRVPRRDPSPVRPRGVVPVACTTDE
jgi:hypothetical protein